MDEYISREAFKARIREQQKKCASPDEIAAFTVFSFLLQAVDEEPAADVQSVKHGEWRKKFLSDTICCSECKVTWSSSFKDMLNSFNYCPNCGARMDGEQNENN